MNTTENGIAFENQTIIFYLSSMNLIGRFEERFDVQCLKAR